jgi:hypothetical protein
MRPQVLYNGLAQAQMLEGEVGDGDWDVSLAVLGTQEINMRPR